MIPLGLHSLEAFMQQGPYVGYSYSYPHKTSYRTFEEPRLLEKVWGNEKQDSLFLYVHIPFCEMRCGFCNLFTFSQPNEDLPTRYLQTLRRQAESVRNQLPNAKFSQLAIGGGTPSFLDADQLSHLFETLNEALEMDGSRLPVSFEVSPSTIDGQKLEKLRDFGVDRVSMGLQSLNARDVSALGRPQKQIDVDRALDLLVEADFPTLNLDLIYGAEQQTLESWTESVVETVRIRPEEIYLYPLYVRPLTGLAKIHRSASEQRTILYRAARDLLLSSGYEQVSMRMFQLRRPSAKPSQEYSCQRDGMIGLGCGARSYTSDSHYGSSYAVKQVSILRLINDYVLQSTSQMMSAYHGIELDLQEQKRRYIILSLLLVEGLDCIAYSLKFGRPPQLDFPELQELNDLELAVTSEGRIQLTAKGIEWSDAIGPWLYSDEVRLRMAEFAWID